VLWLRWGGFVPCKACCGQNDDAALGMREDSVGSRLELAMREMGRWATVLKWTLEQTQTQNWPGWKRKEGLVRDNADLIMEIMKRKSTRESETRRLFFLVSHQCPPEQGMPRRSFQSSRFEVAAAARSPRPHTRWTGASNKVASSVSPLFTSAAPAAQVLSGLCVPALGLAVQSALSERASGTTTQLRAGAERGQRSATGAAEAGQAVCDGSSVINRTAGGKSCEKSVEGAAAGAASTVSWTVLFGEPFRRNWLGSILLMRRELWKGQKDDGGSRSTNKVGARAKNANGGQAAGPQSLSLHSPSTLDQTDSGFAWEPGSPGLDSSGCDWLASGPSDGIPIVAIGWVGAGGCSIPKGGPTMLHRLVTEWQPWVSRPARTWTQGGRDRWAMDDGTPSAKGLGWSCSLGPRN